MLQFDWPIPLCLEIKELILFKHQEILFIDQMEEIHRLIPHRPPFLFIDKIIGVDSDGARAALSISEEMPFFKGHYPGNPIMPGVLLCESVFQTGAIFLSKEIVGEEKLNDQSSTPVLSRIRDARFKRMVKPGDELVISVSQTEKIGQFFNLRGEVANQEGKVVLTVSFALALVQQSS